MAFYSCLDSLPTNKPVKVADCLIDDMSLPVLCFSGTGSTFIDGRVIPQPMQVGKSLEYVIGQAIYDMDIISLVFQRHGYPERPAHAWEKKTFLLSHWKPLAQNKIYAYCEIRLIDEDLDKNESVCLDLPLL